MVSRRVRDIEYAIRDIAVIADQVKKKGKKVYHLNIGDPLKYDFKTPKFISEALASASHSGKNFYADSLGVYELREEISKFLKHKDNLDITSDNIVVTMGVTEAIYFLLAAMIEKGEELLIPGPTYPLYINNTKFYDGVPIEYELNEQDDWEPNLDDLRNKITDKTQAILICSPNNPTGVLFNEKKVKKIIDLAGEYNLPVLSDEIYDQITYERNYVSPASLSKDVPVIGMNGFSKAHLMTGWRLGYIYYHDPENKLLDLKEGIAKLARARLSASSIAQYAAIEIFKTKSNHTVEMVRKLRERRDYSYKRLRQIEGINCVNASGAFYLFPKLDLSGLKKWKNDKEFAIDLLKKTGVCSVYGSGFGKYGEDHIRLTFLPELSILEEVYNHIEDFVR
ncbi:MAG: aminotransferase class I/II-fold pyridoxal phosphate-dependent enzyme [Promethearchaeota archaeon]|nr:MAG: aminotransferase class I/II-fold pyridoxal phosphate-dependent enzyme [Candidatus Lokiarchaeota archaeon]